ncbi:MAG: RT0821/Lpp0805 family surface protein [Methylovulum sp.]|nr:RT0821/Lpp0805 family surface protein [Methylovulum sp.]
MINKFSTFRGLISFTAIIFIVGCASGYGGGMFGNNGTYGTNYGTNNSTTGIGGAVLAAVIQSMAGSVLNGQIGSQLTPTDQNFRLQQLGQLLQTGAVNQPQQWSNPQTGSVIMLNPVGQQSINPKTRQACRDLVETLHLKSGKSIRESRRACLTAQTGKWNLVQ